MTGTSISHIEEWTSTITSCYANNSFLYDYLCTRASGEEVTSFLLWDAQQPPFWQYLEQWKEKAPPAVHSALVEHIKLEVDEDHSGLFVKMLDHLQKIFSPKSQPLDLEKIDELNYTFSRECAEQNSFSFFCGGFYATEIMSAKRCSQLLHGLLRLGVSENFLEYLKIHAEEDQNHMIEVKEKFLTPLLESDPRLHVEVEKGLMDRISRSENYLRWYESRYLK